MRLGVRLIFVGVSNFAYFICMQVHVIGHIHLFVHCKKLFHPMITLKYIAFDRVNSFIEIHFIHGSPSSDVPTSIKIEIIVLGIYHQWRCIMSNGNSTIGSLFIPKSTNLFAQISFIHLCSMMQ